MNERTISACRVVTSVLWTLVGLDFIAAWAAYVAISHDFGTMLALSGCLLVALALVGQMRCYVNRVCSLVRVTSGLEAPRRELFPVQ